MGYSCGRNMEIPMSLLKNAVKSLVLVGTVSALTVWAQPQPAPTAGDAACAAEPTGAALNDTVVSTPDDSGYYNLFDGTFKGWWHSCLTSHSQNNPSGAIFRLGTDGGKPAIYSTQRDGSIGGVLMTKKKFTNYEIVLDFWPDFENDGGLFNRTTANGKCFQTVLDYLPDASMGGTWGEGGYNSPAGRDIRPFKYSGNENTISIPGGADGWTSITSKLDPVSYGCATTGCVQEDYRRLWDQNGWNEFKIQFYGAHAAGTGNVHMKSWFRKSGVGPWVPVLQDTTLNLLTPPGYIGLQVHGGNRFKGPKGTWYRGIKWRPMLDNGQVVKNVTTAVKETGKFQHDIKSTSSALVGTVDSDYEITVQDLNGKTLESFKGAAGKVNYSFKTSAHGWLTVQVKTANGVQSTRLLRDLQ
jgi:hypothetical protein